ncbi:MAG: glycosyltransferase [Betaproteobacteria bacterium]
MTAATNATIVVTEFLRSLYRPELQHLIHVVHDGIERPDIVRESPISRQDHSALLRAMVVTSHDMYRLPVFDLPPVGWRVDVIGRFPPRDRRRERILAAKWALSKTEDLASRIATFRAMLHPRIRYFPWGPESVYRDLQQADIGIIPVDTSGTAAGACPAPSWKVKSENRLTLMMAMGLPVIATPIPSYEAVMRHGDNGFFARSGAEWTSCFHALSDPGLRKRMGARARASVVERFSIELQASRFIRVIESLQ